MRVADADFAQLFLGSTSQYLCALTFESQGTVRPDLGVHTSWLRL